MKPFSGGEPGFLGYKYYALKQLHELDVTVVCGCLDAPILGSTHDPIPQKHPKKKQETPGKVLGNDTL